MNATRKLVLQTLLERQRCTINELAEAVGITPISVRHHIGKLEAEGLVASVEERHGVGRPRRLYYLTEAGLEQFPSQYVRLTTQLLKQLKAALPQPMVSRIFADMARNMARELAKRFPKEALSEEERLELVTKILNDEGFAVSWKREGNQFIIRESVCPYRNLSEKHPEVCMLDKTLLAALLEVPDERIVHKRCIRDGDRECTFIIPATESVK